MLKWSGLATALSLQSGQICSTNLMHMLNWSELLRADDNDYFKKNHRHRQIMILLLAKNFPLRLNVMKKQLFQNKIFVKKSPKHGYGVYAGKTFKKGEILEECYILITKGDDKKLEDYYFDVKGKYALFTGFGIIYNHSDDPNADYTINYKRRLATIKADRTIRKGEEIFISYGDKWFSSRGWKAKH
jgi:uncharacterized protein